MFRPWDSVGSDALASWLEARFDITESDGDSGDVFLPIADVSIQQMLLDVLPEGAREAAWLTLEDHGPGEVLAHLTGGDGLSWVLWCANPSGMMDVWGLGSILLGSRGYIVHQAPFGVGFDEGLQLLGAWSPVASSTAFASCFMTVYERVWDQIGLPPYQGEVASGDEELVCKAMERILAKGLPATLECFLGAFESNGLGEGIDLATLAAADVEQRRAWVRALWKAIDAPELKELINPA